MSFELNEPVVITCTGATSSRNYTSALTEAYYRKIPIIALTFYNYSSNKYNLAPQFIDRSVSQNDIKYISLELPPCNSVDDINRTLSYLNVAISKAMYLKLPVHINCPSNIAFSSPVSDLPTDIWTTKYYQNVENIQDILKNKKFAVFIGSHRKFTKEETDAISNFAKSYSIPVICDHTSNYHGENKILVSKLFSRIKTKNKPELIIDIGEICGEYASSSLLNNLELWRIAPDFEFKNRNGLPLNNLFCMKEQEFFEKAINDATVINDYYSELKKEVEQITEKDIPLSASLIAMELSKNIPSNSSLHLAILNSLRSMNLFDLDSSIDINCNVGGFGIDGAVSTLIGQSFANPNKMIFGLVGDLAFFYDMNILGSRHIGKNVRIIVINNNRGEEFRLNPTLENHILDKTDTLIAAGGHYRNGIKGWAESCSFKYMCAKNKSEFLSQINDFCNSSFDKPVIFEVFTKNDDEKMGLMDCTTIKFRN